MTASMRKERRIGLRNYNNSILPIVWPMNPQDFPSLGNAISCHSALLLLSITGNAIPFLLSSDDRNASRLGSRGGKISLAAFRKQPDYGFNNRIQSFPISSISQKRQPCTKVDDRATERNDQIAGCKHFLCCLEFGAATKII